jgi:transmembrane E3 ubiquitin-protein ligase
MDEPLDEETGTGPGNTRPQRQRSSIPSFLFISFLLFMLTNHNGDEFLARHKYQDALQSLNHQLSNYTAWLNGTTSNFTLVSKYLCCAPPSFQKMFSKYEFV